MFADAATKTIATSQPAPDASRPYGLGFLNTVLVPPSTAPLIDSMMTQGRRLRPDALAVEPRPLRMETVKKLGLKVDTYVPTWPLDGYGTKNIVTAEEVRVASLPDSTGR